MSQDPIRAGGYFNHLLGTTENDPIHPLRFYLETVDLAFGKILYEPGDEIDFVYFPQNAVISVLAVLSDGRTAEMATIGREGVLGLVEALGDDISHGRCMVQFSGTASRLKVKRLHQHIESNSSFRQMMSCYVQFLFTQTLQIGVCNAVHSVEARCCRLILMMRDQSGHDELALTHEILAEMLGVHRPAVSLVARRLQDLGVVKQRRGGIVITSGAQLEEMACECYSLIRRSFKRLLPHACKPK